MAINEPLFNTISKEFLKSKLYHEFTLLYDSILYRREDYDEFTDLMKAYSEPHATYISLLGACGHNSIKEHKEIKPTLNVCIYTQLETIEHLLSSSLTDAQNFFQNIISGKDNSFFQGLGFVYRFIGIAIFCSSSMPGFYINFKKIPIQFRDCIIKWYEAILNEKIDDAIV